MPRTLAWTLALALVDAHLGRHISCYQHILFPSLEGSDAALAFLLLLISVDGDCLNTLLRHKRAKPRGYVLLRICNIMSSTEEHYKKM